MTALVVIDGSAGGGQLLRSSLALSLATGKPFRIEQIRGRRAKPGVLRQHLAAIEAAAKIGDASTEGAELGSRTLTFVPGGVRAGEYAFAIGSAGSTTLVLQTVLLPLALANGTSLVEIEGGTHNPLAPPFEFIAEAFLPLLRTMGVRVEAELVRPGFAPAGGGTLRVMIEGGARLATLQLDERGEIVQRRVRALVANLPYAIAQREVKTALEELGWPEECGVAQTVGARGPGNVVSVSVASERVTDVFTAFGRRGVPAEAVAREAAKQARRYLKSGAAVGEQLADQLLLPLSLGAGGSFTTTPLSDHATTNMEVIRRFTGVQLAVRRVRPGVVGVGC